MYIRRIDSVVVRACTVPCELYKCVYQSGKIRGYAYVSPQATQSLRSIENMSCRPLNDFTPISETSQTSSSTSTLRAQQLETSSMQMLNHAEPVDSHSPSRRSTKDYQGFIASNPSKLAPEKDTHIPLLAQLVQRMRQQQGTNARHAARDEAPAAARLRSAAVLQNVKGPGSGVRLRLQKGYCSEVQCGNHCASVTTVQDCYECYVNVRPAMPCVRLWHKGQRLVAHGKQPESGPVGGNDAEDVGQIAAPKPS